MCTLCIDTVVVYMRAEEKVLRVSKPAEKRTFCNTAMGMISNNLEEMLANSSISFRVEARERERQTQAFSISNTHPAYIPQVKN